MLARAIQSSLRTHDLAFHPAAALPLNMCKDQLSEPLWLVVGPKEGTQKPRGSFSESRSDLIEGEKPLVVWSSLELVEGAGRFFTSEPPGKPACVKGEGNKD